MGNGYYNINIGIGGMNVKGIRFLALIVAFVSVFTFAACTNTQGGGDTGSTQAVEEKYKDKDRKPSTENIEETREKAESTESASEGKEEIPTTTSKTSDTKAEPVYSESNSYGNNANSYSGNSAAKNPSSKPSQNVHKHNWKTTTVHHDEIGHNEIMSMVVMDVIGHTPQVENYVCEDCGQWSADEEFCTIHSLEENHYSGYSIKITGGEPIYEPMEICEEVWVVDTPAWDEKITKCSGCGVTK